MGANVVEQRTRLSAQERRAQLLEVAGGLFAEHGFHGLPMDQIAEAAGVSKPVLYQHFPSKRELYLALLEDAVQELDTQLRKTLQGTTDNQTRVRSAVTAYFDFVEDRRSQLVFGAEISDADVRAVIEGAMARVSEVVGVLIAEDAGLSPSAANFLATAIRGLATEGSRWWLEHPGMDKDEAADLLARLVWRGLGSFKPSESAVRDG